MPGRLLKDGIVGAMNGSIDKCATIECYADGDALKIIIYDKDGKTIFENITNR